jgi:hypothetical protein
MNGKKIGFDSSGHLYYPESFERLTWDDISPKDASEAFDGFWGETILTIAKLVGAKLEGFNAVSGNDWQSCQYLIGCASDHMNAVGIASLFLALGGDESDVDWLYALESDVQREVHQQLGFPEIQ